MTENKLGIQPYTKHFDDHFGVASARIHTVLEYGPGEERFNDPNLISQVRQYKKKPECWGMRVGFLEKLHSYIETDFQGYASAHLCDNAFNHVCMSSNCKWKHEVLLGPVSSDHAKGSLTTLSTNMHLVVSRYVKPWTKALNTCLALVFNIGFCSRKRGIALEDLCTASVFISHCWNESFSDFVSTLNNNLDSETVVWICSFSINQWSDVQGSLSDVMNCPFAIALKASIRVLAVTDEKTEVMQRVWCVLEAHLSREFGRPYDFCLQKDKTSKWNKVVERTRDLDVEKCHATRTDDKVAILEYASQGPGGIAGLNEAVRSVISYARDRACLKIAAVAGDLAELQGKDDMTLRSWRDVNGRTVTHLLAMHSRIEALTKMIWSVDQLNAGDHEDCTPLSLAVQAGQLAAVWYLIQNKANVNQSTKAPLSPLHYATQLGNTGIASALLEGNADIEADGMYLGSLRRCIHIACREGHLAVVELLAKHMADLEAKAANGSTALFAAATKGHADICGVLVYCGAEVDEPNDDKFGRTPLIGAVIAADKGTTFAAIGFLVSAMADPNLADNIGKTALDCCLDMVETNPRCAEFLEHVLSRRHLNMTKTPTQHDRFPHVLSTVPAHSPRRGCYGCRCFPLGISLRKKPKKLKMAVTSDMSEKSTLRVEEISETGFHVKARSVDSCSTHTHAWLKKHISDLGHTLTEGISEGVYDAVDSTEVDCDALLDVRSSLIKTSTDLDLDNANDVRAVTKGINSFHLDLDNDNDVRAVMKGVKDFP